jgi:ABC-2 type transport system ATP-binding protein
VGEVSLVDFRFEGDDSVIVETRDRDRLFGRLPALAVEDGLDIREITSPDDNLQAVFDYLVGK